MARYPKAQWHPVPNENPGGMTAYRFLVLHIMEGTLAGTEATFSDPATKRSSHFGVGKDGTVFQWVDTADMAWAEMAGNPVGISIEHEGTSPATLTPEQIAADSAILAWLHRTHGIPLQVTDDAAAGTGVCGHLTGLSQNWGATACPGPIIMGQRQQIIDGANRLLAAPLVTGISPASGDAGGGDTVTVTGSAFTGATSVMFGQVPGTDLTVVSDTQLTVTSPPPSASGAVDVIVTTPAGASDSAPADLFSYAAATTGPPSVTSTSPVSGAGGGGDTVTVTGSGFSGATSVMFGSVPGTDLTVVSDTQLTVTSPPLNASGAVDVTVTTPAGTSATSVNDLFTFAAPASAPTVTGVSPTSGAAGGGDVVTVTGTGLTGATQVMFGQTPGTGLTVVSDTQLTVTSPPPSASGAVDVIVYTGEDYSASSPADQFSYSDGS